MKYPQPFYLSFSCVAMILFMNNRDDFWWNLVLKIFATLILFEVNRGYLKIIRQLESKDNETKPMDSNSL